MMKYNIKDVIPKSVECLKCGSSNRIPNRFVFRFDPDGNSVFNNFIGVPKEEKIEDSPISMTMFCISCISPVVKIEANMSDLGEEIVEKEAFKIEFEEWLQDIIFYNK